METMCLWNPACWLEMGLEAIVQAGCKFQAAFKTRFGVLLSLVYPSPSLYSFMFIHSTIGSLLGARF